MNGFNHAANEIDFDNFSLHFKNTFSTSTFKDTIYDDRPWMEQTLFEFPDELLCKKHLLKKTSDFQDSSKEGILESEKVNFLCYSPSTRESENDSSLNLKEDLKNTKINDMDSKRNDELCRNFFTAMINDLQKEYGKPLKNHFKTLGQDPKMTFSNKLFKKKIIKKELFRKLSNIPISEILTNKDYTPEHEAYSKIIKVLQSSNSADAKSCLEILSTTLELSFRRYLHNESKYTGRLKGWFHLRHKIVEYYARKVDLSKLN